MKKLSVDLFYSRFLSGSLISLWQLVMAMIAVAISFSASRPVLSLSSHNDASVLWLALEVLFYSMS
jgi:hypothetical protein